MKKDYIKLPVEMLHDPAYGTLTDDLWRLVIQLYMLAGEVDKEGLLPPVRDMAWELHVGLGALQISIHHLADRGLVHSTPQGWVLTGFKESQATPNSTERSRAFRRRRFFAADAGKAGDEEGTDDGTEDATEMQPTRSDPAADRVPDPDAETDPDPDGGQAAPPAKSRRRHRSRSNPVEPYPVDKPVDNFVEKGRKISESACSTTSSTSSLIKFLRTSLNIKLPLLELLGPDSEKIRSVQAKNPINGRRASKQVRFAAPAHAPPRQSAELSGNAKSPLPAFREPVEPYPVDKPVDNFVDTCPVDAFPQEKSRKISDSVKMPNWPLAFKPSCLFPGFFYRQFALLVVGRGSCESLC